jgi:hypothetical protein
VGEVDGVFGALGGDGRRVVCDWRCECEERENREEESGLEHHLGGRGEIDGAWGSGWCC